MIDIKAILTEFITTNEGNHIPADEAMRPEYVGIPFYDAPLVGFASADDSLYYNEFKTPGIIHPDHRTPSDWLPDARTVISFFLPFSEEVRRSNRTAHDEPIIPGCAMTASGEWIHARIEGQEFMADACRYLVSVLEAEGYKAVCPAISPEFKMVAHRISIWSERHTAYAAGLGTFGLSKGLITEKGMAGRFGSIITNAEFPITKRPYSSPFEYCTMCGACAKRCPAGAIDPSKGVALGKDHNLCDPYFNNQKLPPLGPHKKERFGCGKCQVKVPCEDRIPGRSPQL